MNTKQISPLPWVLEGEKEWGCNRHEKIIASSRPSTCRVATIPAYGRSTANAEFIVRACNSHDALLAACKAALRQLHSMAGETRKQLEAAIAQAEPK